MLCEDLPHLDNRVELSSTLIDGAGIPAPKVTYRLGDDAHRAIAWSTERATESLVEAGAHTIDSAPMRTNSHLLGTARMGEDRDVSVVDPWGMTHDVRNLAIIDGSVFVTVGAANPTSTISALALRAVEHLLAAARRHPGARNRLARSRCPDAAAAAARPDPTRRPIRARHHRERTRAPAAPRRCARPRRRTDAGRERGRGSPPSSSTRCCSARPDLTTTCGAALAREIDDPQAAIDDLRRTDPRAYRALVMLILAAYYRSPDVQARIGWPGPVGTPVGRFDYPEYMSEGLLDHVMAKERDA